MKESEKQWLFLKGLCYRMQNGSQQNAITLIGNALKHYLNIALQQASLDKKFGLLSERLGCLHVSFTFESWTLWKKNSKFFILSKSYWNQFKLHLL